MQENQNHNDAHAADIHEIISRQPMGIVRWGVTIIFFVIFSIVLLSWFIKYPDLIAAKVIITTTPPPLTLVSRSSGVLYLLKRDNEIIRKGEMLAYVQSNTSINALLYVEEKVKKGLNMHSMNVPGSLGDIQPYFASMISNLNSQNLLTTNKSFEKQIDQLQNQLITYKKLGSTLTRQHELSNQELKLGYEKFSIDSVLFAQKITAATDFILAKTNWLLHKKNARNAEVALLNNEIQINQLKKQISDLETQRQEQQQKLELAINQSKDQLVSQINKFKENYTFIADNSGRISFLGFLENGQFIESNKSLFSIIPQNRQLRARAELPIRGSGKVKEGQKVNIKLENYPFEQFGSLKGKVSKISIMPDEDKYWVTIELPNQLRTSQNKTLEFKQQLRGNTEIITEDLRLIERLFFQFRKLIQTH